MKPLERIFFQACVIRILFNTENRVTFRRVVDMFDALGFPHKRLWYYISKWDKLGFYDYGVAEDLGWFYPDKFTGEYKVMYDKIAEEKAKKGGD